MPVTVAMYDKGLEHIGERLKALGLDIKLATFSKNGTYKIDGAEVAPADAAIDYLWLNSNINLDNFQAGAFDIALATKSIGVLQTFNAGLDHPFYKKIAAKGTRICNSSAQGVAIAEYVMAQVLERGASDPGAARPAGGQAVEGDAVSRAFADELADRRLRPDRPGGGDAGKGVRGDDLDHSPLASAVSRGR